MVLRFASCSSGADPTELPPPRFLLEVQNAPVPAWHRTRRERGARPIRNCDPAKQGPYRELPDGIASRRDASTRRARILGGGRSLSIPQIAKIKRFRRPGALDRRPPGLGYIPHH